MTTQTTLTKATITRKYLEENHLTMRQMGSQLGVSHQTIANWLSGETEPKIDILIRCWIDFTDWRHEFAEECLRIRYPWIL